MNILLLLAPLALLVLLGFILALHHKNNGIADVFWGLHFLALTLMAAFLFAEPNLRQLLLVLLVSVWAFRLALHIGRRNWSKGEDPRYTAMRKPWGKHQTLGTFLQVFLFQAILALLVVSPVLWAQFQVSNPALGILDFLGVAVWLFGFLFESIGDAQLARFVKTKKPGEIMTKGLWAYTRHPNYFGEVTQWWGIFLVVLSVPRGFAFVFGPILITCLILFVSGIPLLEKRYAGSPAWELYKKRTSVFFPWPPRK